MPAVSRQLAEAVKNALNEGSFSVSFEAIRDYLVVAKLEDISDLRVVVFAADQEQSIHDRQRNRREQQIDIGIQKKLSGTAVADVDPLVDLTEEIADYLSRLSLSGYTAAHWLSTEILTAGLRNHLVQKSVYTGVVRVTYRVVK